MEEWMKGTVNTILMLLSNWIREWMSATVSVCGGMCLMTEAPIMEKSL